jgi:RNA polymerase sigma-70 factor (ECF subfamily)
MRDVSQRDEHAERNRAEGPGETIAREFRRGSPQAVSLVQDRVRRIVRFKGFGMSADDRKDLRQEVMGQIWQAATRPGFDAGDRFWGFVEVVTARRCIDWLRGRTTRGRELELDERLEDGQPSPLGAALDQERYAIAREAIAELGKPCQELIRLHFGLDKSYRELAALLGKSEGALRVQMHRCIARTREIVGRPGPPSPEGAHREKR